MPCTKYLVFLCSCPHIQILLCSSQHDSHLSSLPSQKLHANWEARTECKKVITGHDQEDYKENKVLRRENQLFPVLEEANVPWGLKKKKQATRWIWVKTPIAAADANKEIEVPRASV